MRADGGSLPVQALPQLPLEAAAALHRHLLAHGICAVPQRRLAGAAGREVFLLTARTTDADVDAACEAVARAPQLALLRRDRRDRAAA